MRSESVAEATAATAAAAAAAAATAAETDATMFSSDMPEINFIAGLSSENNRTTPSQLDLTEEGSPRVDFQEPETTTP